jgi:hypothetical protein
MTAITLTKLAVRFSDPAHTAGLLESVKPVEYNTSYQTASWFTWETTKVSPSGRSDEEGSRGDVRSFRSNRVSCAKAL